MILFLENSMATTKKTTRKSDFSEVARYKINRQKWVVFLYTHSKQYQSEIKKAIPFSVIKKGIISIKKRKFSTLETIKPC